MGLPMSSNMQEYSMKKQQPDGLTLREGNTYFSELESVEYLKWAFNEGKRKGYGYSRWETELVGKIEDTEIRRKITDRYYLHVLRNVIEFSFKQKGDIPYIISE